MRKYEDCKGKAEESDTTPFEEELTTAAPQPPDKPEEALDQELVEQQDHTTNEAREAVTRERAQGVATRSNRVITRPVKFDDYVTY